MRAFFCHEGSDGIAARCRQVSGKVFFLCLQVARAGWLVGVGAIICDASDVLMREREHLRQQVVLVEVLQVVDLVERSLVLVGYILDLV